MMGDQKNTLTINHMVISFTTEEGETEEVEEKEEEEDKVETERWYFYFFHMQKREEMRKSQVQIR